MSDSKRWWKVTITCGAYNAPCIYVEAASMDQAVEAAKAKSGLARFKLWIFIPKPI